MPSGIYIRKPFSETTRKNMSNGQNGKKHSDITKLKISQTSKEVGVGKWMKDRKLSEETIQKIRYANSGEKSYRWIEDRSKVIKSDRNLHDPEYKQFRKKVCNRDNWKCKINNSDCEGRLEVHHILGWKDNPELRYEVNNGITLCHFHHPHKRKDENKLSPYFQKLVTMV